MILPWQRRSKSPSDSRFMLSALSLVLVKPKANAIAKVCNVLECRVNCIASRAMGIMATAWGEGNEKSPFIN